MTLRTRLRRVGLRSRTSCCISLLSTPRGSQLMGRPSTTKSREGRVNASFFPTRTNLCFEKRRRDEADDDTVLVVNFNPAAGHPLPRSARSGAVREIELSDMAAVARPDDEGRSTSPGRAARARTRGIAERTRKRTSVSESAATLEPDGGELRGELRSSSLRTSGRTARCRRATAHRPAKKRVPARPPRSRGGGGG